VAQISFARGVPSPDILPLDTFGECARAAVERDGKTILNYGPAGGYAPLREWVAGRHGVEARRVFLTNGSLQAFNYVARLALADGGRAIVEAPSYDRTLQAIARLRADVVSVPLAEDGLDVDAVERALDEGPKPALLYTIPTFQNPSGRTLSVAGRRRLAALAAERGILVYEDDPYGLVRFEGETPPSLLELAGGDTVVFSSSFSKTIAPGIRVGYVVVPDDLVAALEQIAAETTISPSVFVQGALMEFVRQGNFEPNLERTRQALRARRDAMLAALDRFMPEGSVWSRPEGGYFVWLDFPAGVRADELLGRAGEAGVTFVKGSDFYVGPGGEESARLAFSFASVAEIERGIEILAGLVRDAARVAA